MKSENERLYKHKIEQLNSALDDYFENENSNIKIIENYEFSDKFKRGINRIFREEFGSNDIPHKMQDNFYEKLRSKKIYVFKHNRDK